MGISLFLIMDIYQRVDVFIITVSLCYQIKGSGKNMAVGEEWREGEEHPSC